MDTRSRLLRTVLCVFLAGAAGALAGCATGGDVTQMQLDRCEKRLNAVTQEKEELRKQLNGKEVEMARIQSELKAAQTNYSTLQQKSDQREEAMKTKSMPLNGLESEIVRLGFPVTHVGNALSVNLAAAGELFDPGQVKLSSGAQTRLRPLASLLAKSAQRCLISVQGHSDNTPIVRQKDKYPTNYELSFARARVVQQFLVDVGGLDRKNTYPASRGEYDPIAPNKTSAGKARNRRVELLIMPL